MAEKVNPWLDEGTRYDQEERKKQNIRDLKFLDNNSHTVRILPSKTPGKFPFFGYKQHWIPQNASTTGKPITHGIDERCPVCEWLSVQWDEVHRLKEEEDMTDKSPEVVALLQKIGRVSAKTRYDMNVIHREDPYVIDEETKDKVLTPKRMGVGGTVYKEIFSFAKKWGSPSNDETGYDLEIQTTGAKEKREYRTIPDRDASPLTAEERKAIDKCYILEDLRKTSTLAEMRKFLENAKAPYTEILEYFPDEEEDAGKSQTQTTTTSTKKDKVEEVEKEIEEKVAETKATKTKEPAPEPEPEPEPEADSTETKAEAAADEPVDDEHNLEVYECKGDYDENDKMCSDCPVKGQCEDVHPFYVKAKQLKIDIDPHRPTKEVVAEVEKAEATTSAPKRGKKIPF